MCYTSREIRGNVIAQFSLSTDVIVTLSPGSATDTSTVSEAEHT